MFATQVVTQTSDTAGDPSRATVTQTVRYVVNTLTIRVAA